MDNFLKEISSLWSRLTPPAKGIIVALLLWLVLVVFGIWKTILLAVFVYAGLIWGKLKQQNKTLLEYLEEIGIIKPEDRENR